MRPNLKTLEDRVHKVVRHLRAVTDERDRLREQVEPLRERMEAAERSTADAALSGRSVPVEWDRRLEQVERILGETVVELRGD